MCTLLLLDIFSSSIVGAAVARDPAITAVVLVLAVVTTCSSNISDISSSSSSSIPTAAPGLALNSGV